GGGNAGDHVGSARTGGSNGNADASAGARVTVGHVRGALLVANQNVAKGRESAKRVVGRENGAARITEDVSGAFPADTFPENFCTGLFHKVSSCEQVPSTEQNLDSSLRSE